MEEGKGSAAGKDLSGLESERRRQDDDLSVLPSWPGGSDRGGAAQLVQVRALGQRFAVADQRGGQTVYPVTYGRFRIDISMPHLPMIQSDTGATFFNIMCAPNAIEEALIKTAGGES